MTQQAGTTGSTPRFRGGVPSSSTVASLSRGDRILIITSITLTTVLAWTYLIHLGHQMSSQMESDRTMAVMGMTTEWTAADVGYTLAMWAVMMVGMMAPAAAPVMMLFAASKAKRAKPDAAPTTLIFGLGYVAVWIFFSVAATFAQWALHHQAMLSSNMATSNLRLGGTVLIAAGLFQVTPWKNKCLAHCRSPLGFLMANWRDGALGSFEMGVRHGGYCLGCCWALMLVLFAVGVMNLVWVGVLTVFILIEKIAPGGTIAGRIAGAALILAGVVMIATR
jgi:predicted metal-binding membrane protein